MSSALMSQAELETAYDQSKWAANMRDVLVRYGRLSDAMRVTVGEPVRISYGPASGEALDLYAVKKDRAPVVVFVHGGGWRGGFARDHAFPAEMLQAAGIHFAALDFWTIVDAQGDLAVLVDQVRRAISWLYRNCAQFGGDASELYIAGHSSGAHLAAMALSTQWSDYALPENPISGAALISGIYDLGPLRHTSRGRHMIIDDRIERQLSPVYLTPHLQVPLLLAVGSSESPEFQRQTREYAKVLSEADNRVRLVVADTYNHFDILETLGNPYGLLGRELLGLVERTAEVRER